MPSMFNEAVEWVDRAEQAREVAGQLTDPGARKAVLELADSFERLARAAAAQLRPGEESWPRKTRKEADDSSRAFLSPTEAASRESKRMSQHRGFLTPEERARIMQLQDLLIDRFVEHREATAAGQEERAKIVEGEIDGLLAEKAEIEKWAAVGSA
jgi:hypothetical protein